MASDFPYDDNNEMHRRALAAALLAALATEEVIEYTGECELTSEAEARLLQTLAAAGCTREEIAATMRLESGVRAN